MAATRWCFPLIARDDFVRIIEPSDFKLSETLVMNIHYFYGEQDIPATPCVVYSGNDAEGADFLYLAVDRQRFLSVKNAEEGIAAIMAAFWLFNIKYPTKAANTVAVLERLFVGFSSTTPRPVVTKFLNKVARE